MQITAESKSQLAKLMASENLTVQHRKTSTAYFLPKERVLVCPIWQDMAGDLYDLCMGHEVGHALYTPVEGWHNAASNKGKNYKHFLNIVEDARIEKKIKRKYPGLIRQFASAYKKLTDRDFFGIRDRLMPLTFIDRINLETKIGQYLNVDFHNDTERQLIAEVNALETWDDVVRVTDKIWEYSKSEQKEMMEEFYKNQPTYEDGDDGFDDESLNFGDEDFESEEGDDGNSDEQGNQSFDDAGEEDEQKGSGQSDEVKDSDPTESDKFQPRAETDENYRRNELKLLDDSSKEYVYVNVPASVNLKQIITPASRVHQLMMEFYKDYRTESLDIVTDSLYKTFRQKNDRYISLLAKEFEMRKAASKFAKAKVSNTGDIDINKIYKYQIDDTIFRKMMRVPKGKSHGLVLLLDKSGSMSENMASSVEQVMILASFCRKVNIPFVVYGFGNALDARKLDFPDENVYSNEWLQGQFSKKSGEIYLKPVFLREYLSSNMGAAEFQKSLKSLLLFKSSFEASGRYSRLPYPPSESLSNTPLIESIFALKEIVVEFRKKHNLDIVNTVIVHDGDADAIRHMHADGMRSGTMITPETTNCFLVDRKNKFETKIVNCHDGLRAASMDWLTKVTGAKVYGFFITETNLRGLRGVIETRYQTDEWAEIEKIQDRWERSRKLGEYADKYAKLLRKEKLLECKRPGYANFFLIPGGDDLKVSDDTLNVNGKVTSGKLANAFMKMNKSRKINRVLVSKFIGGIAV
jgi:hypothetical protein